ncbi:MAG: hypothetical protein NDI94_03370, partial [Candidatus Woesearchaeota archaeon]|nr:hypothetical protein [Candidatus Woesearchaeota archaeon]
MNPPFKNEPLKEFIDNLKPKERKKPMEHMAFIMLFGIFILGCFLSIRPEFTGMATYGRDAETIEIGKVFHENSSLVIDLSSNVTSIRMSGEIIGNGTAKVYANGLLILDSSKLNKNKNNLITGFVIEDIANESDVEPMPVPQITDEPSVQISENDEPGQIIEEATYDETASEEEAHINNLTYDIEETENPNINTPSENETSANASLDGIGTVSENASSNVEGNDSLPLHIDETSEEILMPNNSTDDTDASADVIPLNETETNNSITEITDAASETFTKITFEDHCADTCIVSIDGRNMTFHIILNDAILNLSSITYIFRYDEDENLTTDIPINITANISQNISQNTTTNISTNATANLTLNLTSNLTTNLTANMTTNVTANLTANITTNVTANLTTNLTMNVTTNLTMNLTMNITMNLTLNLTMNQSINMSMLELAIISENYSYVEINKPVQWIRIINASLSNKTILPDDAFNISTGEETFVEIDEVEYGLDEYNDIALSHNLERESKRMQRPVHEKEAIKVYEKVTSANKKIISLDAPDVAVPENVTLEFRPDDETTRLTYFTQGPYTEEKDFGKFRKQMTISSDIHYENVLTYTDITEAKEDAIKVYWIKNGTKYIFEDVTYIDTDSNGFIDRLQWMTPHLSNQTFEISITVLNPYSYLRDGDIWTVAFNTTGIGNLTISSPNANWTEFLTDDTGTIDEMRFINLSCGNNTLGSSIKIIDHDNNRYGYPELSPTESIKATQIIIENYECNSTGYLTNHMNIAGYATLFFEFSNQNSTVTDYAYDPDKFTVKYLNFSNTASNKAYLRSNATNHVSNISVGDFAAANNPTATEGRDGY